MRQSVNYTLYWLRLLDNKGRLIYKDPNPVVFDTKEHAMNHVHGVKTYYEGVFRMKLKDAPHLQQTPKEDLIMDVVGYVSMYTGITRDAILGPLQDRDIADVRKIISYICRDMGLMPSQIHRKTGFDRGGVYAHISRAKELIETNPDFKIKLENIQNNIIKELKIN